MISRLLFFEASKEYYLLDDKPPQTMTHKDNWDVGRLLE
jgi:hypothetical protein